jgi:hypothetical protein
MSASNSARLQYLCVEANWPLTARLEDSDRFAALLQHCQVAMDDALFNAKDFRKLLDRKGAPGP